MAYWELFQDPADIGHYLEIRIADTWTEHMRQHERVTKNVQLMEDDIRALLKDGPQPIVSHYIGKVLSNSYQKMSLNYQTFQMSLRVTIVTCSTLVTYRSFN